MIRPRRVEENLIKWEGSLGKTLKCNGADAQGHFEDPHDEECTILSGTMFEEYGKWDGCSGSSSSPPRGDVKMREFKRNRSRIDELTRDGLEQGRTMRARMTQGESEIAIVHPFLTNLKTTIRGPGSDRTERPT